MSLIWYGSVSLNILHTNIYFYFLFFNKLFVDESKQVRFRVLEVQ